MSKRQLRISDPEQLKRRAFTFVNRKVSFILKDNTVLFGKLKMVDNENLYLLNMSLSTVKVPMESVVDFFTDIDS